MPLAAAIDVTGTPNCKEILNRVSPCWTVYVPPVPVPGTAVAPGIGLVLPPQLGMVMVWPTRMEFMLGMPLADANSCGVILYFIEMRNRLSPATTVWVQLVPGT